MKLTTLTTAVVMSAVIALTPAGVRADTATASPSPTPTPKVETRTVCTTGAYGQQTCKTETVEVKKVLGDTTPKKAEVKQAGVEDTILFAALGLMAISAYGFVYAKQK